MLALALLGVCGACVAPVVQPAGRGTIDLTRFPTGSSIVAVTTSDGCRLRGVHVPASPDAPLIVHFLPSGSSITTGLGSGFLFDSRGGDAPAVGGFAGLVETLDHLRGLGFASLVLDYRGVGASEGERDPRRLGDDAWAVWQEALARTGRPERIVLRAVSLGTLPSAELIERGAEPAGWILIAPILSDTIGLRAAQRRLGTYLGMLRASLLRRPSAVDLPALLQRSTVPVLLLLAEQDELLPPSDRARVERAAHAARHAVELRPADHQSLVLRSYGFELTPDGGRLAPSLLPSEAAFLATLLGATTTPSQKRP